jgi:hypothetical protein
MTLQFQICIKKHVVWQRNHALLKPLASSANRSTPLQRHPDYQLSLSGLLTSLAVLTGQHHCQATMPQSSASAVRTAAHVGTCGQAQHVNGMSPASAANLGSKIMVHGATRTWGHLHLT